MIENNIKQYRKKFKVTQQELAEELGTSKQYISNLELCKTIPSIEGCFKIINAFQNITCKKSNGKQVVQLKIEDMFYEI